MKKLVYFTNSYPFSAIQKWKADELSVFRDYFDDIVVAPLTGESAVPDQPLPEGIRFVEPVFGLNSSSVDSKSKLLRRLRLLNHRMYKHVGTLQDIPRSHWLGHSRKWLSYFRRCERILTSEVFRSRVLPELKGGFLLFFWAAGYASILPFLPNQYQKLAVVRFHGYDLYLERNGGFIPDHRLIAKSAAILAPISSHGAGYLTSMYPSFAPKIICQRLGIESAGQAYPSSDGIFRIVSCGYARPEKRLHLIAEGLRYIQGRIEWTHIGDGLELPKVMAIANHLPSHVTTRFVGKLSPEEVPRFYVGRSFDLFVNVSESEGIPVSAMEAMAVGIPVLATSVGGTSELVGGDVGRLLPANFTPTQFVAAINEIASHSTSVRDEMRRRCQARIRDMFDSATNSRCMAKLILSLGQEASDASSLSLSSY